MVSAIFLERPDFLAIKKTPEARKSAISYVIQGLALDAVSKAWEDQIKTDLKGKDQFFNVMGVYDVQVKAITKVCDNRIRDLSKKLADRVDSIFKNFTQIVAHFDRNGNVRDIKYERAALHREISDFAHELDAIFLVSEAGLKAIQDLWLVQMESLKQNPFKLQAQYHQDEVMGLARSTYIEATSEAEKSRLRIKNVFADLHVMETENASCKDPQARIEEIEFIGATLPATINTINEFFEKNEEMIPFLIFLTAYWYAYGDLSKEELPWFLPHHLRQEIQRLRNENPSGDLSIERLRYGEFFADFRKFASWKYDLKDKPNLEKLVKVSDKMLEDEEFTGTFVDCWHASVDSRVPWSRKGGLLGWPVKRLRKKREPGQKID